MSNQPVAPSAAHSALTCQEVADFLMDYLDATLSTQVRAAFEQHLHACPACVSYLKSYQSTILLAKLCQEAPPDAHPPDTIPPELIQAIRQAIPRD
jgi:anti-sigma factor RsiW